MQVCAVDDRDNSVGSVLPNVIIITIYDMTVRCGVLLPQNSVLLTNQLFSC